MRSWIRSTAVLLALGALVGVTAAQQAPAAAPPVTLRFDASPMVECYFFLRTFTPAEGKLVAASGADFTSEAGIFTQAASNIQDPAAWRWFLEQVVAGPDVAAVRQSAKNIMPAFDTPRTRTGINMLVDALESAYPKYLSTQWVQRQRSINRVLVAARRKYMKAERRIAETLMQKMVYSPIDAPVTVYIVFRAGGVPSWGKTAAGYYTVVGLIGLGSEQVVEMGIHEATHVIDAVQSYDTKRILMGVRQAIKDGSPEAVEAFIHGLVTYNAGILVKRFINSQYQVAGVFSPSHREEYAPYISTYDVVWNAYLDGKLDAAGVVAKLAEEFRAIRKLEESRKR